MTSIRKISIALSSPRSTHVRVENMVKRGTTRFPVARIKKLIQADEDVGKVAQGVPVVVSKAIELFLAALVGECVKDADGRSSTKITAYGLKRTVNNTPMFDFCSDIVAGIPDPITGEDGEEGGEGAKKKRKRKAPVAGAASTTKGKKVAKTEEEGVVGEEGEVEVKPKKVVKRKAKKEEDDEDEDEEDDDYDAEEGDE